MKKYVLAALSASLFYIPAAEAAVVLNRTALNAALGSSFTDTYDDYGTGTQNYTDAQMTAKKGQTSYTATTLRNLNFVINIGEEYRYCSGCNGSFTLGFGNTSFGNSSGVFGVGFDVDVAPDTFAFVTFGDRSSASYALSTGFFGLTSDLRILSIAVGSANGVPSSSFAGLSTLIDNLTIGSAATVAAVPEPATWAMMLVGFGLIGATARYRRRSSKVAYA